MHWRSWNLNSWVVGVEACVIGRSDEGTLFFYRVTLPCNCKTFKSLVILSNHIRYMFEQMKWGIG